MRTIALMSILDWIDVGQVAAERDDNLSNYFYDAGLSRRVIGDPRQFLLLGRKGAGKTAVFRHLQQRPTGLFDENDNLVALSFVNYSWKAHALLANAEKAPTASQRDSWRFVIAVECVRALVQSAADKNEKPEPAIREAAALLERLFSKPVPSWLDLLGGKLFRLSKFKAPSFSQDGASLGEVNFSEVAEDKSLKAQLAQNLENITAELEAKLKAGMGEQRVFLIFDSLDEAWDQTSLDECKRIITGLIHAADHYTTTFKGSIRPIVFLREDIFGELDLNDKNKLREDCGSILSWNYESLEKMLLTRINFFAKKANQPERMSVNALFDRKEMRNRSSPRNYIFQRTFSRPRDVVAYVKKIIESRKAAKAAGEEVNDADELSADAIYDAEPAYSEYLVNEIKDEWKTQTPDIEQFLTAFENISTTLFSPEAFEAELRKKKVNIERSGTRAAMRFLFDNSIIGIGVNAGTSRQWRYKCVYPTQRYEDADQYQVHSGLKRHLGLRDPKGNNVTE